VLASAAHRLQKLCELLVVDERLRVRSPNDINMPRRCICRIQIQNVGAELATRDRRLDEPPMISAHDRDRVTVVDSRATQRIRQGIRTPIRLSKQT
jgi:hypothetical protein